MDAASSTRNQVQKERIVAERLPSFTSVSTLQP